MVASCTQVLNRKSREYQDQKVALSRTLMDKKAHYDGLLKELSSNIDPAVIEKYLKEQVTDGEYVCLPCQNV